jgi:hypothetical protein
MEGIKDKVAIVGMGCTKFGERWDKGVEDLIVEAAYEALEDAGIEHKDIYLSLELKICAPPVPRRLGQPATPSPLVSVISPWRWV